MTEKKETTEEKKRVSLNDISRELKLSKSTVSRALSGKGRISESTRNRINSFVKEIEYRPNLIARSLAQSKTYNLGVIFPADSDLADMPFFQVFLLGVCEVAAAHDYDVVVTVVVEKNISALKRLVRNRKVDGIILTRLLVHDLAAAYLKKTGIPFVVVGTSDEEDLIQVDTDHTAACCKLTSILLAMGNRKIALIIGSEEHAVNVSRLQGYFKAFENRGESIDKNLVFQNIGSHTAVEKGVEDAIRESAECILCGDDIICGQVLSKIQTMGLTIPDDVRVASFYNSAFLRCYNPPITALEINVKELGVVTGQSLMDLISKKEISRRKILNYEIVLKKSTQ